MAADAIFAGIARDGGLNPVFTLGMAAAGTALVLAGLLFAFSRQVIPPVTAPRLLLRVVQVPIALPARVPIQRRAKSSQVSNLPRTVALPQPLKSAVLPQLPALAPSRLDLSMGLPSPTHPLPATSGPHAFNPYSDLYQALNSPPKPPILKNGQTLRLVGHKPITKIAGRCYEEAHLPKANSLSSLPGQTAFMMVHCPGEYQPTMGDELKAWADKERKKLDENGSS